MFVSYRGTLSDRKFDFTVRLNIRNVFDDTDPVPMNSLSDGFKSHPNGWSFNGVDLCR